MSLKLQGIERVVVWFSAGVTSAVAAKITLKKFRGRLPVNVVICDTGSEDLDNWRFTDDVAEWLGIEIERIKNEKYVDTIDVYLKSLFIKSQFGAKCTVELKKVPRRKYENIKTDLQVFGFDAAEKNRAARFNFNNPEINTWFPLIEKRITKHNAREMLLRAGIVEPRTYAEGFNNANCLNTGCVKGGAGYWNLIRRKRPEVFDRMAKVEREIGHSIIRLNNIPVFLDELPENAGNHKAEPAIQCGLFCGEF